MEYVSDELKFKISFTDDVNKEAERNCFEGRGLRRYWSLFVADVRCNFYLLWAGVVNGECEFKSYDENKKTNIIGTSTGNIFDGSLVIRHVFWCSNNK